MDIKTPYPISETCPKKLETPIVKLISHTWIYIYIYIYIQREREREIDLK